MRKFTNTYIFILIVFFNIQLIHAQINSSAKTVKGNYESDNFNLPADWVAPGQYTARDYVNVNSEFNYASSSENALYLKTNPWMNSEPAEGSIVGGVNGADGVVGTMEGNFSVSPNGAAIYTVPIKLPLGVSGMTPELELFYNSQLGVGVMGKGWGISGLSSITRTAETYYYNGAPGAIDFEGETGPEDQMMLDGKHLILVDETTEEMEFRTEIDEFSLITYNKALDYYTVKTKSGLTKTYGNTSDSRHLICDDKSGDEPLIYHIKTIEDRLGNYIEYEYNNYSAGIPIVSGECNITQIYYTKHSSKSKTEYNFKVQFEYEDLNNTNLYSKAYFLEEDGDLGYVTNTKKLNQIKVYKGSSIIKKYELEYEQGGIFNHYYLNSIQEYGTDNSTKYNKTVFEWDLSDHSLENSFNIDLNTTGVLSQYKSYSIDVEGKGTQDIIHKVYSNNRSYLRIGDHNITDVVDYKHLIISDFNADNKDELLLFKNDQLTIINICKDVNGVYSHTANTWSINVSTEGKRILGDFDGDGINDFLFKKDGKYVIYFGDKDLNFSRVKTDVISIGDGDQVVPGDFDGDGKTDLCVIATFAEIYKLNDNLNAFETVGTSIQGLFKSLNVIPGDFNGDGKTDLVVPYNDSWEPEDTIIGDPDELKFYFFAGGDTYKNESYTCNWAKEKIQVRDINNDGRTDIYFLEPLRNSNTNFYLDIRLTKPDGASFSCDSIHLGTYYTSDGSLFKNPFIVSNKGQVNLGILYYEIVDIGDDWVIADQQCKCYKLSKSSDEITAITNGLGSKTHIGYSNLNSQNNYSNGISTSYPVTDFWAPMLLVDWVSHNNTTEMVEYDYVGAKTHRKGKGFLGFEKVIVKDLYSGIKTITTNEVENSDNHYFLKNVSVETRSVSGDNQLSFAQNTYKYKSTCFDEEKVFFPYVETSVVTEKEIAVGLVKNITKVYSEYDLFGNATKVKVSKGTSETNLPYIEETSCIFTNDKSNWILGKLDNATVLKKAPGAPNITRKSSFGYNSYGMISTETIEPDVPEKRLVKEYIYDFELGETAYGNVRKTISSCSNEANRISETTYTSDGRFVKDAIRFYSNNGNIISIPESFTYDAWGNIKTHSDANNFLTSYVYDAFNRLRETHHPDGNKTYEYYRWVDNTPLDSRYYRLMKQSGAAYQKVYFDKYDRKQREVIPGFDGVEVFKDYFYSNDLRLWKSTKPYFEGDSPQYIVYHYDEIGRNKLTEEDWKGGQKKKTQQIYSIVSEGGKSYHQVENKVSIDGKSALWAAKKQFNAAGWLYKSIDNDNKHVSYTYYSNGKVESFKPNYDENRKIEYQYDIIGNTICMKDPDLGEIHWTYNAFGEIKTKKQNGAIILENDYDELGRLKTKTLGEGIINFKYDSRDFGIGAIAEMSMNYQDEAGNSSLLKREYFYDNNGRINEILEKVDDNEYAIKHAYDRFGREQIIEYPSGYKVYNYYTGNGYLNKKVDSKGNKIWEAETLNASGQIEAFKIGDVISNQHNYNPYSGKLESIFSEADNSKGRSILQDIIYNWNDIGTLESRNYVNKGLKESFTYDDLMRLRTIQLNETTQLQSITYDDLGNIETKTGISFYNVGTYNYDDANSPNKLTSINGNPSVISDFMQSLSYTSFNKVYRAEENGAVMDLIYGMDKQRIMQKLKESSGFELIKTYIGGIYEKEETSDGDIKEIHYIKAPTGLAAVYTITNGNADKINYILNDHLGSMHMVLNAEGESLEELSFDAWGNRRNPDTFMALDSEFKSEFSFGFTGHEHHDLFSLINMNGRVYDPTIGRFLSPDPFIQSPDFSQSLNRYAYCFNNPLSLTDPSGYSAHGDFFKEIAPTVVNIAVTAVLTPYLGPAAAYIGGFAGGAIGALINGGSFEDALIAGHMGGMMSIACAGLSYGIGELAQSMNGATAQFFIKTGLHGVKGGLFSLASGGKFEHGFIAGAVGAMSGMATQGMDNGIARIITAAVIGGTAAELSGGKFANGAVTSAFTVMFNDMMHEKDPKKRKLNDTEKLKKNVKGFVKGESVGIFGKALDNAKLFGSSKYTLLFKLAGIYDASNSGSSDDLFNSVLSFINPYYGPTVLAVEILMYIDDRISNNPYVIQFYNNMEQSFERTFGEESLYYYPIPINPSQFNRNNY